MTTEKMAERLDRMPGAGVDVGQRVPKTEARIRIACVNHEPISRYRDQGWSAQRLSDYYNPASVAEAVCVFCPGESDWQVSPSVRAARFESFRDLKARCEAFAPDVIRCYEAYTPFAGFALMLSLSLDVPSYLSLHDGRVPRRSLIAGFTTITAYTGPIAEVAARDLGRPVETQLNPVNPELFRPRAPRSIDPRVAEARHRVFTIGRIDPVKNLDVMMQATGLASQRIGPIAHVIAGPGTERFGFDGTHLGIGPAEEETVCDYLNWASVFLQVQLVPDVGMAATEALMVGRPVILTGDSSGNAKDVVGPANGDLVALGDVADPGTIARTLERVLQTSYDRERIRAQAVNVYGIDSLRSQEATRYRNLVRGNSARHGRAHQLVNRLRMASLGARELALPRLRRSASSAVRGVLRWRQHS